MRRRIPGVKILAVEYRIPSGLKRVRSVNISGEAA